MLWGRYHLFSETSISIAQRDKITPTTRMTCEMELDDDWDARLTTLVTVDAEFNRDKIDSATCAGNIKHIMRRNGDEIIDTQFTLDETRAKLYNGKLNFWLKLNYDKIRSKLSPSSPSHWESWLFSIRCYHSTSEVPIQMNVDRFGVLQFITSDINTVLYKQPPYWLLYQSLLEVFHAIKQTQGNSFTNSGDLNLISISLPLNIKAGLCHQPPIVLYREEGFTITIATLDNSMLGHIDNFGVLWFENT
ncbi:unnamed protein product [Owenia fusiformis]|nr:unnamed protein product [Owenia fusiformis]